MFHFHHMFRLRCNESILRVFVTFSFIWDIFSDLFRSLSDFWVRVVIDWKRVVCPAVSFGAKLIEQHKSSAMIFSLQFGID